MRNISNSQLDASASSEIVICGFHAVEALFALRPHIVKRFFLTAERLPNFKKACKYLASAKKFYKVCGEDEIYAVSKTRHHQGLAALIEETPPSELYLSKLEEWAAAGERSLFLVDVGNDHNLGAVLRSAAFFGWKRVITAGTKVKMTSAAYRTACGGAEYVQLFSVKDAGEAVAFIKKAASLMSVLGACAGRGADAASLRAAGACMLVLGNEETGLPEAVERACTRLVQVKGSGLIESLNVSAAAATLMMALSIGN